MTTKTYTAKSGKVQFKPIVSEDEMSGIMADGTQGFCLACGAGADGVEPDARKYKCESCGANKVYSIEELLMMGLVVITADNED